MNYIEYINSYCSTHSRSFLLKYLISGVDPYVRRVIGNDIVNSSYCSGKLLFVVDNTQSGFDYNTFGRYQVSGILDGEIDLCSDLLETSTISEISRLRSLLIDLGFECTKAMKVLNYLSFVKETESRLGNTGALTVKTLEEYGSFALIKWKLQQLVEIGMLSTDSCEYLLARYSEVSAAAADFEMFLMMLAPFIDGRKKPERSTAVHLPIGEYSSDPAMQQVMCKIMLSFIKKRPDQCTVVIIDDGMSDRAFLMGLIKSIPTSAGVHLITTDAFSLSESDLNVLMNCFNIRVYSRHDNMASCEKIEACCGYVDVVKRSYTVSVDKRIRAYNAFDMLLGTNRTETEISNAPVREARFRKETINSLCSGTAIIDCGGTQVIFQF